jgi:cell division protein ZapA (FtsZ GTPase activity inhibitor)
MGDVSLKIKIAGSEYPLRLNAEDEEIVQKAASIINERYAEFENKFSGVREKKDILAMAALQLTVDLLKGEKGRTEELNRLQLFVQEVNSMVEDHQSKLRQDNS